MAEFDYAGIAMDDTCKFMAGVLRGLLEYAGNENNFPGALQAAQYFVEFVAPVEHTLLSDELATIAQEIQTKLDSEDGWKTWGNVRPLWIDFRPIIIGWLDARNQDN